MLGLIIFSVVILLAVYNFYWKRRNLPPGPAPLPFIGNLHTILIKSPGYSAFKDWRDLYGPVYTVWFGEMPMVVVAEYEKIMETFHKDGDAYAGRVTTESFAKLIRGGTYGVVFTEGDLWKDQRRFALHVLRDFGLGKNIMQERILNEVSDMILHLKEEINNGNEQIKIPDYLDVAVGSIINALLFGYRFEGEKLQEFKKLKVLMTDMVRVLGHPMAIMMWNNTEMYKYIPGFRSLYYRIAMYRDHLFGFFEKQVEEHQTNVDLNSEPTDYVDAYLREKAKRDQEIGENGHFYNMIQLNNMLFDLWLAGQETTSNTLAWGVLYLMLDQDIQKKLHKELDVAIGSDRLVTLNDRQNLPYTNAVVNEIQRIANLLAINVVHKTLKNVEIDGFHIPANTTIIPQISTVLYDEKIFPEPQNFDPNRFLDENGQLKKVDEFIPFSVGKRQCLGESLARMELFLFTANIFNQFRASCVPNNPPSLHRKIGATITPQPYECKLENRH